MDEMTAEDLRQVLAPFRPLAEGDDARRYETDWPGDIRGAARLVVRPDNTAEVAEITRLCAARGIPVVPQGGHTGLVGGATPSADGTEVVVSLERMNRVRAVDPLNYSMVVEAGCVLADIHAAASGHGRAFPLHLGAEGTCQIGGNIATNAGGINVLRFGMTRDLVLGLEVVLPDGTVWNGLRVLRKNNTGYDLKQLFIGSEGTLGIITAAALKIFPLATQVKTAFLALPDVPGVLSLYERARSELSDLLSAFEILDRRGVELAVTDIAGIRDPLGAPAPQYVLMEVSAGGRVDVKALVEGFLESAIEDGVVIDGALAASGEQARSFWRIREGIIEAQARRGRHLRTDVSVPISSVARFLDETTERLLAFDPPVLPVAYGHVGDGNIHFNVVPPAGLSPADAIEILHRCEDVIFEVVDGLGGSISAEHGIGRVKRAAFLKRVPPLDLDLLHRLKSAIDPDGLLNPGRLLETAGERGAAPAAGPPSA